MKNVFPRKGPGCRVICGASSQLSVFAWSTSYAGSLFLCGTIYFKLFFFLKSPIRRLPTFHSPPLVYASVANLGCGLCQFLFLGSQMAEAHMHVQVLLVPPETVPLKSIIKIDWCCLVVTYSRERQHLLSHKLMNSWICRSKIQTSLFES